MAGISFDDLIPQKGTKGQAQGLSFDDLIPQAPQQAQPETETYFDPIQGEITITKAQSQAATANTGGPGVVEALSRGGLQGGSFGSGDEIYAGMEARRGEMMRGRGQGENAPTYDQALEEARAGNKAAEEAHPWAYNIGKVAGNAAALIPAGATAIGGRVLGMTGTILPRMVAGTTSGAALGGAQGYLEDEGGVAERSANAGVGAGFGAFGGAVGVPLGAAAGAGARWVADTVGRMRSAIPGMGKAASRMFTDDIEAAGLNQVQGRLNELGDNAMLLDASPALQSRAQGIATESGAPRARETLVNSLTARDEGTNGRLATDVNEAFGPAPIPSQIEAGLAASRDALGPEYERALAGASAVDTRVLAARLETAAVDARGPAQRAINQVRQMLDIPGAPGNLDPNPRSLLSTRQAIDGMLATEADPNTVRVLTNARNQVDAELARAIPGVKEVDAQYAELARQSEGLRRGSQVLDSGKTAIRPVELAQELADAAQPQGTMVGPSAVPLRIRQGTRADFDRALGTHSNDLVELRRQVMSDGDWNREKLAQLFGEEAADRVFNAVDRETAFRQAYRDILQGSQTAQRTAAKKGVEVRGVTPSPADVGTVITGAVGGPQAVAAATGLKAVNAAGRAAMRASDIARNEQLARVLTLPQGRDIDAVLAATGRRLQSRETGRQVAPHIDRVVQALMASEGYQGGMQAIDAVDPMRAAIARALISGRY